MLALYLSPGACSLAPHIALEEAGAKFEVKPLALRKGDQRKPEFQAINPKGKVPVLVIDGKPLTENVAILTYIARTHPAAKLMPTDLAKEMEVLSLLSWAASGVHTMIGRLFRPAALANDAAADAVAQVAREGTAANFALIDKLLAGKQWVAGDYSVADAYFFVFWRWANFLKLDLSAYSNYAAHAARMAERPAVKRALARETEAQATLDKAA